MNRSIRLATRQCRPLLIPLVVIGCLLAGVEKARAYDKDTHYALMLYLARLVGFSRQDAQQIASLDFSMDLDRNTDPTVPLNLGARVQFHAFLAGFPVGSRDMIAIAIQDCLEDAKRSGNPGTLLHFVQDKYSHDWYGAWLGQWGLPPGTRADFIAADKDKALRMARETVEVLQKFRTQVMHRNANDVSDEALKKIIDLLSEANPAPPYFTKDVPNYDKAAAVIQTALGGESVPELHPVQA